MNKYFKRALIVTISLVLVYTGLRLYLNYKLREVLIHQVEQFADKNYQLKLGSIDIGWWAYNASIHGLQLIKIKNKESLNDKYHFTVAAKDVKLRGLYLYDLLFNQQLQINKLEIINPTIIIDYNDTLLSKQAEDSSLVHLYYKLSNIILKNPSITVRKISGEKVTLKSNYINYSFKHSLLKIEQIKYEVLHSKIQNFDAQYKISKASLFGFDLNVLMNESNFKFSSCSVDSIDVKLVAHTDTIHQVNKEASILQKLKSKSNLPIYPINIKHIQFRYQSKYNNISASAANFAYINNSLSLSAIKFSVKQKHLFEGEIEKLSFGGFLVDEFIHQQHCAIGKMKLVNPQIKTKLFIQENYAQLVKRRHEDIGYMIDSIAEFEISNGNFTLSNDRNKNIKLSLKSIQLLSHHINTRYFEDSVKSDLVRKLNLKTGLAFLNFANNLYHLKVGSIHYNLSEAQLAVNDFSIKSNYKKSEFHGIVKKQVAMIDLELATLGVTGFDLNWLINEHQFECDEVNAENLNVIFYKDKNIPLLESDTKKFPQQLLRDLNYPILVKTMYVKNASLISEILNPGAKNIAKIKVDQVQFTFSHIDNHIYKGNKMDVSFEGRIASSGLLKATASIDMYAADFKHSLHAEIGNMPFKHLNDFMFDFAGVEINQGTLDKAIIDIKGNRKKMQCKLDLTYHDLNMDILRNQNRKHKRYRNVASILANAIIYNHNPEPGKPLRRSVVEQAYISNKFIVGNWINVSLKAMLVTTAPTAANALQINNLINQNDSVEDLRQPNWLKRFIEKKKIK